jgi:hypothetical protein
MKILRIGVFISFVLLMAMAGVRADVIVDNLNQPTRGYFGPIGTDANTNDFLIGQQFILPNEPTPYLLNKITVLFSAIGGGASITLSIWRSDDSNNPTNEIGVVATQSVTTAGTVDFMPTTNIMLSPGTYFVVAAPATPTDSGYVSWAYANTTNWAGTGRLGGYADTTAGAWFYTAITNYPQQIRVEATPATVSLTIQRNAGVTTLTWPSSLTGYVPDTATNLASPVWQLVTNTPVSANGNITAANNWTDTARYFRLHQSLVAGNLDQPTHDWDGPIGTDNSQNDFLIGQEFVLPAGNYALNKVTMRLNPAIGLGSVTASLWHVGVDGNPTYCIVAAPTTPSDNALVGWDYTLSTSWTGFGSLTNYADTYAGPWENLPLSQGPFQLGIQVTPTP